MALPFRVGILGAGQIAAGIDVPDGPEIRGHLKAILAESRLSLTCMADRDPARAEREARRFNVDAKIMTPDAIVTADLDALCIASPDGTHVEYIERAASGTARVVLCEKPLDGDAARRRGAMKALAARGAMLSVHHLRRWIPGIDAWIDRARSGQFGRPLSAVVHYGRGYRHNGVHALDLVAALIGTQVDSARSIGAGIEDYSASDPTLSLLALMRTEGGPVPLLMFGVDGRVQTNFSVDVRFERARVHVFDEAGIRAELHQLSDVGVPGYAPELQRVTQFRDEPPRLVANVWRNIADHLESGAKLACAGEDALLAYELADAIEGCLRA